MKTLALAAAAALSLVPAATAARQQHINWKARATHEARLLHRDAAKLRRTRTALVSAREALASTRAALATARSQQAAAQAELAQRTRERDAAVAQTASLRAKLDAIPTPLAVAIEQVKREVAWAEGHASYSPNGRLVALSAMDYVLGHVSVGAYAYLIENRLPLPPKTSNATLGTQAGYCGETSLVFARIVQAFGYQTRRVAFYWTLADGRADAHTAVEVFYDGSWHYFDPTFGQYWTNASGDVQSITDARSATGTRHKDAILFTNLIEDALPLFSGDDTSFETDPATSVVIGGAPFNG
jgi:hypothetical protein